jgi:prevent-host-death family protein
MDHSLVHFGRVTFAEGTVQVSVTDAKAQLTELVRRAESGDEVILTRHGHPAVRLVAVRPPVDMEARRRVLEEIQRSAAANMTPGPDAAHSQDFLYDERGLPA